MGHSRRTRCRGHCLPHSFPKYLPGANTWAHPGAIQESRTLSPSFSLLKSGETEHMIWEAVIMSKEPSKDLGSHQGEVPMESLVVSWSELFGLTIVIQNLTLEKKKDTTL